MGRAVVTLAASAGAGVRSKRVPAKLIGTGLHTGQRSAITGQSRHRAALRPIRKRAARLTELATTGHFALRHASVAGKATHTGPVLTTQTRHAGCTLLARATHLASLATGERANKAVIGAGARTCRHRLGARRNQGHTGEPPEACNGTQTQRGGASRTKGEVEPTNPHAPSLCKARSERARPAFRWELPPSGFQQPRLEPQEALVFQPNETLSIRVAATAATPVAIPSAAITPPCLGGYSAATASVAASLRGGIASVSGTAASAGSSPDSASRKLTISATSLSLKSLPS